MVVVTALIAGSQAAQPGHQGVCTFHDSAMASHALAAVNALSGYAGLDAAYPAFRPATAAVVGLVGMQLAGPAMWTAPLAGTHGRNRVQCGVQPHVVMTVIPAQSHAERCSAPINDKVPFGAGLAAIRGVRPRFRLPFFGGDTGAVQRGAAPVQLTRLLHMLQQRPVQASRLRQSSRQRLWAGSVEFSIGAPSQGRVRWLCGVASAGRRRSRNDPSALQGYKRFRCRGCGKQFNERSGTLLNRTQYPSDVVALVVLWRLRFKLSLHDLPEMFAQRGMVFSHEAVRAWEAKLTPVLAEDLRRRRRGKVGRS